MSDSVPTPSSVPANADGLENREPTTTEIDARHARQLVERALSQLERGERSAAEVSVRQAIHLSPGVPAIHSLAGLLALLDGDMETARIGYENAVTDFSKASPERERLIALRMAQADSSGLDAGAFVPNLPAEIARLRMLMHDASPQSFLSDSHNSKHAQPRSPHHSETPSAIVAPSPALVLPPVSRAATRPAFASRLEQRQRASAWAVGIAAVSAAIVAFFVMRALVAPRPAPQAASTPVANQVVENAPSAPNAAPDSATGVPAASDTGSTPDVEAPASNTATNANASDAGSTPTPEPPTPTATVTVKPLPPARTAPAPRPTPKPAPRPVTKPVAKPKPTPPTTAPVIPGLPRPAPTPPATPRPAPTPTPHDPNFPPMPAPKITLPSAGGEKTEFPRVIPED
jgi:hypothetical protein